MPLGKSDDDTEEGENAVQGSLPGLPKPLWSGGASAAQLLILCSLKTSYEPPQREHGSKSTALPLYLFLPCFHLIESMEERKLFSFHAISRVAALQPLKEPWPYYVAFPPLRGSESPRCFSPIIFRGLFAFSGLQNRRRAGEVPRRPRTTEAAGIPGAPLNRSDGRRRAPSFS